MSGQTDLLLIGMGGLGCPLAEVLARSGSWSMTILDPDCVELSNLHRQTLFEDEDAGRSKVDVAAERLSAIGESAGHTVRVEAMQERFVPENAAALVRSHRLVVEGADNFATKFLAADACFREGIPLVQAGVVRWSGWAHAQVPRTGGSCLRCIFEDVPQGPMETCSEAGVLGPVVGVVASFAAALTLRLLWGDSSVAGELWSYEALSGRMRRNRMASRADCSLCAPEAPRPLLRLEDYVPKSHLWPKLNLRCSLVSAHSSRIPEDLAYLNCAYMAPLMRSVSAAGCEGVRAKATPWAIDSKDFFVDSETTRALFAQLIGAQSDDIAFVPSVSYGIATAAKNLPCARGQKILVLEEQFPSNVYSWRRFAEEVGAFVHTVRSEEARLPGGSGHDWTQAVLETVDEDVAVVALPHCHWTDGSLLDLEAIGRAVRKCGGALVLDITQSCGALPFDVRTVQPDFVVCSGYKWLLGPYSLGFMYVSSKWHQGHALEENWLNRQGSEDFAQLVEYRDAYQPGARRFDMGERSSFHLMPMAQAALRQIHDWGVKEIAETLAATTARLAIRLEEELGLLAPPEQLRAGHYLGLALGEDVPGDLLSILRDARVFVSMRGDALRITPHVYNNEADAQRLIDVLKSVLRR